jgi:hypothetical protein
MPPLGGSTEWLNSEPLGPAELRGEPSRRVLLLTQARIKPGDHNNGLFASEEGLIC